MGPGKALALLGAVALALPATAQAGKGYRAGIYAGKTSQKLPVTVYVEQAEQGELGRRVTYTGITGKRRDQMRHVASAAVRVTCASAGGTRWTEVVRFHMLGRRNSSEFSAGGYAIRGGRLRYAVTELAGEGAGVLDERIKGRVAGSAASGTLQAKVTLFGSDPNHSDVKVAGCDSGRVRWTAKRTGRRSRGEPRVGPEPPPPPRRVRHDTYVREYLDESYSDSDEARGFALLQNDGGGSFTAYVFQRDGRFVYCRRTVGPEGDTRDYRPGSWSLLEGHLWYRRPGLMDGRLRLRLDGDPAAVDAELAFDGLEAIALTPAGPGFAPVSKGWKAYVGGGPTPICAGMEYESARG